MDARLAEKRGERRRTRRHRTADEHGITAARVRPGYDLMVIDVCADGALVETDYRLLPGTSVDLQFDIGSRRVAARGSVLRCAVVAVRPGSVIYRAAIRFDRSMAWLRDAHEKRVPIATAAPWAVATRQDDELTDRR